MSEVLEKQIGSAQKIFIEISLIFVVSACCLWLWATAYFAFASLLMPLFVHHSNLSAAEKYFFYHLRLICFANNWSLNCGYTHIADLIPLYAFDCYCHFLLPIVLVFRLLAFIICCIFLPFFASVFLSFTLTIIPGYHLQWIMLLPL